MFNAHSAAYARWCRREKATKPSPIPISRQATAKGLFRKEQHPLWPVSWLLSLNLILLFVQFSQLPLMRFLVLHLLPQLFGSVLPLWCQVLDFPMNASFVFSLLPLTHAANLLVQNLAPAFMHSDQAERHLRLRASHIFHFEQEDFRFSCHKGMDTAAG